MASRGSNRFIVSHSWWIASELVRRHPELIVYEMHPGGGSYDLLCVTHPEVVSPGGATYPRVMLNRAGTIQVHDGQHHEIIGTWNDAFAAATPHTIIKAIEKFFAVPPEKAPETTPRALVYRFIATALSISVNALHPWDARCEFVDSSGEDDPRAGYLSNFPAAVEALRSTPAIGIWGEPQSHFWALLLGQDPVAIISIEGTLYLPTGKPINLMKTYLEHERRIVPMTVRLLKALF
ncbi:hypothetical protein [Cryobacterium arcticum]|uniref:TY-Chap2 family putative peptide chaperone n=1 Tax=Cryobacterium arcticum TaxID=670052 RepID=UPI003D0254CD